MLGKNQRKMLLRLLKEERAISDSRSAGSLGGGLSDGACRTAIKGLERLSLVARDGKGRAGAGFSTWGTRWHLLPAGRGMATGLEDIASC